MALCTLCFSLLDLSGSLFLLKELSISSSLSANQDLVNLHLKFLDLFFNLINMEGKRSLRVTT